jgi:hypothetical protein
LVGEEGVEPVIDWLRASYSAVELRSRELVPPIGIEPIVGRLSSGCSAVELRGHGGKVRFRSSPYSGSVLQTDCRSHRLSLPGARARGRSEIAPYQSGALPLCYAGRNGGQPGA